MKRTGCHLYGGTRFFVLPLSFCFALVMSARDVLAARCVGRKMYRPGNTSTTHAHTHGVFDRLLSVCRPPAGWPLQSRETRMGILSNIFSKIFPSSHAANKPADGTATADTPSVGSAPVGSPAPGTAGAPAAMSQVDVASILDGKAQQAGEKLNWRTSIVDLLKLLQLDSSLQSRKELAQELHYSGDTSDSAAMNIWLHKQVMNKVAANGGTVPADLKD